MGFVPMPTLSAVTGRLCSDLHAAANMTALPRPGGTKRHMHRVVHAVVSCLMPIRPLLCQKAKEVQVIRSTEQC